MTVRMPSALARLQMSSAGKVSAEGEVMSEKVMTYVRGGTPSPKRTTNASGVVKGNGMG